MDRQTLIKKYIIFRGLFSAIFLLASLTNTGFSAEFEHVKIVSLPGNSAHQKFVDAFRVELLRLDPSIKIIEQSLEEYAPNNNNSLIVTLGSRVFSETGSLKGKKLHTLIPHSLYKKRDPLSEEGTHHLAFNQPPERILRLQNLALPNINSIGILLGSQHSGVPSGFYEKEKNGRELVVERVGNSFSASLSRLLSKSDSLLLLPDSSVINRSTINTLVLDSYHKKVPLLGYSKALVKAGALLAIYSTPEQLGEESAQIASRIISGKSVPFHNYPKQFEISVNYKLSRVYGLSIPSEDELHEKVMAGEKQ